MKTGAESVEEGRKKRADAGFSLIELMVVLSIIMTMTGITVMGMGSYRGKMTERQVRNIADELLLTQNAQQTRPGIFCARLIQDNHVWSVEVVRTMDEEIYAGTVWTEYDRKELGSANALQIADTGGRLLTSDRNGAFLTWRFDRETGACTEGVGSIILSGSGKKYRLTVFGPTGRTEVRTVHE
ncbi:MAG: prepilin-type N-terminal cleavage/methylation domain-containing protein [Lachnospiraceae bacterium]|nr:prepilin-type N-terminal cleavage/methylation domain-containing protein [Lachnospiraceae bacterium]